ncbi:MAG: ChaB family protein [Nitrososphaera sp.]|uniref:ChaB family protein n=1 Tax=Nitrososphaera sp. TaxID=1971748 RepID=UPI003D6ED3C1
MPRGKLSERMKKQIDELPQHGQHIFKKARESALKQYKDPAKRRSKSDKPEEVAHKVAWSAVKKKYKKSGEKWISKKRTK